MTASPTFAHPARLLELLAGYDHPWFVAGGWALDLFLGRVTRPHADLEIAILRRDQADLRAALPGWRFYKAVRRSGGEMLLPWREDETLAPPVRAAQAHHARHPLRAVHIALNEAEGAAWRYWRVPAITRPLAALGLRSPEGIPYLTPEVVLLGKAQHPRARDMADFQAVLPALGEERRRWLYAALVNVHPDSGWLAALNGTHPE